MMHPPIPPCPQPRPLRRAYRALRSIWPPIRDTLLLFLALLAIQTGVVQAYVVPTGSMERTILPGELILADKVTLGPRTPQWIGVPWTRLGFDVPSVKLPGVRHVRRGDIVVVEVPVDRVTPYVKRVVALGGDVVELRGKELYVNGERAEAATAVHADPRMFASGWIDPGTLGRLGNRDHWGPYTVPAVQVFLLGDNRDFSADSRYWGPVPEKNIIGRARLVLASWDQKETPEAPWKGLRLGRTCTMLD